MTSVNQSKAINRSLRNATWVNYNGMESGVSLCYCCNLERISFANFQCGHVHSRAEGGQDTLSNLRPICASCNVSMGKTHMKTFAIQNGYSGRIVTEVAPSVPVPEVIISVDAADNKTCCAACQKPYSAATLAKNDGKHCTRCFKQIYWFATERFLLTKALAGLSTNYKCPHCEGAIRIEIDRT